MEIFNITIQFDHDAFREAISDCIERTGKGYICVVDANVITMTHKDEAYRNIVKNAYANTCDGSSIATMANSIYHTNFRAFNGPDVFAEYIEKTYKQLLLGNTEEKFNKIKKKLAEIGKRSDHLTYMSLPFATVDKFDYEGIARKINEIKPDIIWVSLGAPKQENFMFRLLPYLKSGLMFGIGAAFGFYVGDIAQPKAQIGALRFIWIDRLFREPKKQLKRVVNIFATYPSLYFAELIRKYSKS